MYGFWVCPGISRHVHTKCARSWYRYTIIRSLTIYFMDSNMSRNIFFANEGNGACFNVLAHIKVGKRQICAKYAICFFSLSSPSDIQHSHIVGKRTREPFQYSTTIQYGHYVTKGDLIKQLHLGINCLNKSFSLSICKIA